MTEPNSGRETWRLRLANFLIDWRLPLFAAGLIITAVAWPFAERLRFDHSIESLYAADNPHLQAFLRSQEIFGSEEIVMVAYTDPGLFASEETKLTDSAQERLDRLADQLRRVPGVMDDTMVHVGKVLSFRFRRGRVLEFVEGFLVGKDRQTVAVVFQLEHTDSSEERSETLAQLRAVAAGHDPPAHVAGAPVMLNDMFRYIQEDSRLLFRVSLVLLMGVIFLLFRSIRWMLLPALVVVATILWTEAVLNLSRMRLSMVSSVLNSLITVIGVATVVHVAVYFRDQRRTKGPADAFRQTFVDLAGPVTWTALTTATGFAALLSSQITPVRSFGTMMALGTVCILLTTPTLLPGGMLMGRDRRRRSVDFNRREAHSVHLHPGEAQTQADPQEEPGALKGWLVAFLGVLAGWVERYPGRLSVGAVVLVVVPAWGLTKLEVLTDITKNFRASSPIVQSLNFIEARLGGVGIFEVNFPAPGELTPEFLSQVRELTENLRELAEDEASPLTKVVSFTDGLALIPRIPIVLATFQRRKEFLDRLQPGFETSFYNREEGRMRIVLRALEQQPSEKKLELMRQVERLARQTFPEAKVTGMYVLLTHLVESLLRDQYISFLLAATGIGGMMTIAFRSLRIGLISLAPNVFPIVLVVGMMGWIGLPVNIATAMIASVSVGLTVDGSIHYLAGFRRAQRRGLNHSAAMRESHQHVGRALVFATLALVIGFLVLTLSHFIPLIHFGVLISVALLGGLIGSLLLLPLLLRLAERGNDD